MGQVVVNTLSDGQQNVDGSDFNALVVPLANEFNGAIDNTNIASNAAIAYSKLSLGGSISNSDIASDAAIAYSKLATLTDGNILVGNGSNEATSVAVSGDVTIDNTGAVTIANDAVEGSMLAGIVGVPGTYHVTATSNDDTTSTSYTDLDSMSITFTPSHASNPILIMFSAQATNTTAAKECFCILDISGSITATECSMFSGTGGAGNFQSIAFQHYTTLAASSQTVKVQFKAGGGGGTARVAQRRLTVIEFKQN